MLLTSEQLRQIFRTVARQQQQSEEASAVTSEGSTVREKNTIQFISFAAFKQALIRICIYAHDKLGGQSKEQVEHAIANELNQKQMEDKLQKYV